MGRRVGWRRHGHPIALHATSTIRYTCYQVSPADASRSRSAWRPAPTRSAAQFNPVRPCYHRPHPRLMRRVSHDPTASWTQPRLSAWTDRRRARTGSAADHAATGCRVLHPVRRPWSCSFGAISTVQTIGPIVCAAAHPGPSPELNPACLPRRAQGRAWASGSDRDGLPGSQADHHRGGVGEGNPGSHRRPTRQWRTLQVNEAEQAEDPPEEALDTGTLAELGSGPGGRQAG
jgi:hypothetical protein